jgi:hypothetical protein
LRRKERCLNFDLLRKMVCSGTGKNCAEKGVLATLDNIQEVTTFGDAEGKSVVLVSYSG